MSAAQNGAMPPRLFERVRVVTIQLPNYPHSAAFDELAESFVHAFSALGAQADSAINQPLIGEGINFVFGAHLLAPTVALPPNSIIVNLEQLRGGVFAQPHYLERLKHHPVLDYSARNVARLRAQIGNVHVHAFEVGTMPAMSRIAPAAQQDVDVLFYGSINERRRAILDALSAAGLVVKVLFGVYGAERDAWIARSKIVLNVHFYEDQIHELVRTSYLLANRKLVVSECEDVTEIDADVRQALVAVAYNQLVGTCVALVRDEPRRRALEHAGFECMRRRNQAELLKPLLAPLSLPLPRRINLGSGKAYDPERLNIDVDPQWQPDILGDISKPHGLKQIFFSPKFGLARLDPGEFDEITAMDVLEHVPDLVTLMTHCLDLLRVDGVMRIGVPYDLSWGAWQDPTHIRAFNERSWLYYTDWHWYLGWDVARFHLAEMNFALSPVGEGLRQRGMASEDIFRTPRAVDSMQVLLTKRLLDATEKQRAVAHKLGPARHAATLSVAPATDQTLGNRA
ncbi:MAG: hypothetical protein JSR65_10575 [Proteobacteria bacterium]|nr:hypothetical protein [Pseudomonadota bacterium]